MHCPMCGSKFGFIRWLRIMNPSRVRCDSCETLLATDRSSIQPTLDGLVFGLVIAGFASYMNALNIWRPIESLLWFAISLPLFCGAYSWFIWRDGILSVARFEPGNGDRYRAAVLFLIPAALCTGLLGFIAHSAGILNFSELFVSGTPRREMYLFFYGVSVISLLQMLLLVTPIHLSRAIRLAMLVICLAIGIASFWLGPAVLVAWIFPAWYVYRLVRFSSRRIS
ncbi:hypothetical protein BH11PSE11_BH11PSE11_22650 [soil metagenome]